MPTSAELRCDFDLARPHGDMQLVWDCGGMGSKRAESSEQVGALCRFLYVEGGDEERVVQIRRGEGFLMAAQCAGRLCGKVGVGGARRGWWRTPWLIRSGWIQRIPAVCLWAGVQFFGGRWAILRMAMRLQFKYSGMHELHVSSKILNSCLLKKKGSELIK
jgi:hypothetical protein